MFLIAFLNQMQNIAAEATTHGAERAEESRRSSPLLKGNSHTMSLG